MSIISWELETDNRIVSVAGDWTSFASENGAPELAPASVVGQSLWTFVHGSEIRSMYTQMFERARATREPIRFRYRCDAPNYRRNMRMSIEPAGDGRLYLQSEMLGEEPRPWIGALDREARRSDTLLDICSVCRRVHVPHSRWLEPEDAAEHHDALLGEDAPMLVERLCDDCVQIHGGVRYLVTDFTGGTADGPVPLVVFLHGGGHDRFLLRLQAPPRLGGLMTDRPFLLLSPVDPASHKWQDADLDGILEQVVSRYPVDTSRIHFFVDGAGATEIWNWAKRAERSFASLVPIAGYLTDVGGLPRTRVCAVHGRRDKVVPLEAVSDIYGKIPQLGDDSRVIVYDDGEHDVWSRAYRDPDIWSWMLR